MALAVETAAAPQQAPRRMRAAAWWLAGGVAALLVASVALRVWHLGNLPGVNGDEAWSGVQAARLVQGEPIAWRTPSGNPVNVFFLLPLAALHWLFPPSFTLLRSVAVVSGLAALAANWLLCRKAYDERTALVSTIVLAVLPINVAYSRFAWDASQSLLATVLVLYLPLIHYRRTERRETWPVAAMIALAAAIVVHPTNVFAAPLVVVPIAYMRRQELVQACRRIRVAERTWSLLGLAAVATAGAYLVWFLLNHAAGRPGPQEPLLAFMQNYVRLFSGATVYTYLAGVDAAAGADAALAWLPLACNLVLAGFLVVAVAGLAARLHGASDWRDVCLLAGWFVMLAGFFIVAGPRAIAPHFERYGICLVAPGALVLARGIAYWVEAKRARWRVAAAVLLVAAWLFPVTFYLGYFAFIEGTGGCSHRAFRTAAVEPKQAAYEHVLQQRSGPARIVADDWWTYWPLAYLASMTDDVRVVCREPLPGVATETDQPPPGEDLETWYVTFAPTAGGGEAAAKLENRPVDVPRAVIDDYAGRPLLRVDGPEKSGGLP